MFNPLDPVYLASALSVLCTAVLGLWLVHLAFPSRPARPPIPDHPLPLPVPDLERTLLQGLLGPRPGEWVQGALPELEQYYGWVTAHRPDPETGQLWLEVRWLTEGERFLTEAEVDRLPQILPAVQFRRSRHPILGRHGEA